MYKKSPQNCHSKPLRKVKQFFHISPLSTQRHGSIFKFFKTCKKQTFLRAENASKLLKMIKLYLALKLL